jgi:hypothetical protein
MTTPCHGQNGGKSERQIGAAHVQICALYTYQTFPNLSTINCGLWRLQEVQNFLESVYNLGQTASTPVYGILADVV